MHRRTLTRRQALAAGAAALWPAAGLAQSDTTGWPRRFTHALGETVLPRPPRRVLALGWSDAPVAQALGAPLVAALQYTPGPDGRNFPWTQPPLAADVAVIPATQVDLELLRSYEPDLILAITAYHTWRLHYSGLAAIAPTLVSTGRNLRDDGDALTLRIGQALGQEARAQALVQQARAERARFAAQHRQPNGQPQRLLLAQLDDQQFLPMLDATLPVRAFLADLGLQLAGTGADGALIDDGQFQCNGARAQPLSTLAGLPASTRLIGLPFSAAPGQSKLAQSLKRHQAQGRLGPNVAVGDRWLHDALLAPNPVNTAYITQRLAALLGH